MLNLVKAGRRHVQPDRIGKAETMEYTAELLRAPFHSVGCAHKRRGQLGRIRTHSAKVGTDKDGGHVDVQHK
jgi:hypothetical protein